MHAVVRWWLPNQTSGGLIWWQNNLGTWWWWAFDGSLAPILHYDEKYFHILWLCLQLRIVAVHIAEGRDEYRYHCFNLIINMMRSKGRRILTIAKFPPSSLYQPKFPALIVHTCTVGSLLAWERSPGELRRSRLTIRFQSISSSSSSSNSLPPAVLFPRLWSSRGLKHPWKGSRSAVNCQVVKMIKIFKMI